ncbi:uncharacterized protein [Littorina saxatilis]|uniref:uncharacterized protein n=1 Tax=Littorina saxatilis TaxID=31220 RepID=UPI0038B421CD
MDRTIKVTGFYLKSHVERKVIENKLRFLFLGVGQVEQVSLSEDRNSARVRFYHRDALNFVSKQEWRLGSAHLRVKPFVPPSDDKDNARPSPVQLSCKPELPGNKDTPQKYSLSSYCDSRNKFWVDIPHETFTVVPCARRKRKRCCNLDLQHAASFQQNSKRKKRKTKPGKKKKNAQLESFAPLPFGITCISQEKAQV